MALPEYSGPLEIKRAAHLLRRATFGATKPQIDSFATLTPQEATVQLFGQSLPAPVLPIDPKTGQEWVLSGITDANSDERTSDYLLGGYVNELPALAMRARKNVRFFIHILR